MANNIYIVEDEAVLAETLRMMLVSLDYTVVGTAHQPKKALEDFNNLNIDLVMLDINLGKGNEGIELANVLKQKRIPFIFLTSYGDPQTIQKAKVTGPAAYLLKPFSKEDIYAGIEIALINAPNNKEGDEGIIIKDGHVLFKLNPNEIKYLKSDNIYVDYHTLEKRHTCRTSLDEALEHLPDYFVRVHRSYVVNMKLISSVEGQHVYIKDIKIPISRKNKDEFMDKFRKMNS